MRQGVNSPPIEHQAFSTTCGTALLGLQHSLLDVQTPPAVPGRSIPSYMSANGE